MNRACTHPSADKISVIIPAKNSADAIGRAIRSASNQSKRPSEIIVVDDDSDDDTGRRAAEFAGVSVHRVQFSNRALARNLGVERATGSWIAFLDSDDEWAPDKLERQTAFMTVNNLDLGFHDFSLSHEDSPLIQSWAAHALGKDWYARQRQSFTPCGLHDIVGQADFLFTSTALIRRELWMEIGGMRKEFKRCQDIDAWLRTYEIGGRIGFLPEVLAIKHAHRQITGAVTYWYKLLLLQAASSRAVAGARQPGDRELLQRAQVRTMRSFAGWARRNNEFGLSMRLYLNSMLSWIPSGINRMMADVLARKRS